MTHELKQFQGSWAIASLEVDGASVPPVALQGATITVDGDRFQTAAMGAEYSGRIELDASAIPKRITMHFESGPEAGNKNLGIYEFQAEQWRLCLNMSGGAAPGEFQTTAGGGLALQTLTRASAVPREAAPVSDVTREAVPELQGVWAMVECVRAGQPLPGMLVRSGKRTISGVESALHFGPQLYMQGLLSRDGGTRFLKLEHTAGELQGGTQLGIFDLDGNTLRTCFGAPGQPRPSEFSSSATGGETLSVWKRAG